MSEPDDFAPGDTVRHWHGDLLHEHRGGPMKLWKRVAALLLALAGGVLAAKGYLVFGLVAIAIGVGAQF